MRSPGVVLSISVVVALVAHLAAAQQSDRQTQTQPRFRSSVDVVSVTATVHDRKGRVVRDLAERDFIVAEGGESRQILDFRSDADGPVRIAFLFDVSGSMRIASKTVDARLTARQFLSALRPDDQAAVFAFDTRLERVSGFTSDAASLDAALDRVDPPYGQTSLYDAIADAARSAVQEIRGADGKVPRRTAVVVLTDGIDTRSRLTPPEVSAIASGIDVPVYVVAVMSTVDDPGDAQGTSQDRSSPLRELAEWTGGELFTASTPAHASLAARQVVDELRHQYVIAFEASSKPGWQPLEVRARNRDLVVRARAGYIAGGRGGSAARGITK